MNEQQSKSSQFNQSAASEINTNQIPLSLPLTHLHSMCSVPTHPRIDLSPPHPRFPHPPPPTPGIFFTVAMDVELGFEVEGRKENQGLPRILPYLSCRLHPRYLI